MAAPRIFSETEGMHTFAARLRHCITMAGWSDAEAARRFGMQPQRLAYYLSGRSEPDFVTVTRICTTLGTSPNYLLGFESTDPPTPDAIIANTIRSRLDGMRRARLLFVRDFVERLHQLEADEAE